MNCEYQHKVNKKEIPVCNILGVNIAAINMDWLLDFTDKNIKDLSGDYMCVSNVHTTVTSYDDPDYCAIQNGGIMAIPDGGPLSTVGRKRGYANMERTTGPSYMGEILKASAEKGYRHYFYGSTEETLEKLYEALNENYPGIQIAGMYSPPFRPMTAEEDVAVVKRIGIWPSGIARYFWIVLGDECNNNAISDIVNPSLRFSWANFIRNDRFAVLYNAFISSVTLSVNGISTLAGNSRNIYLQITSESPFIK